MAADRLTEEEIGGPLPLDVAGRVVLPSERPELAVTVRVRSSPHDLRRCLLVLLRRTDRPFALRLDPALAPPASQAWIERLRRLVPNAEIASSAAPAVADWQVEIDDRLEVLPGWFGVAKRAAAERPGATRLAAAALGGLPGWLPPEATVICPPDAVAPPSPDAPAVRLTRGQGGAAEEMPLGVVVAVSPAGAPARWSAAVQEAAFADEALSVAYLLPGLASGGGGGSHSIVQEAVALRRLGVDAVVFLGRAALEHAHDVYADHRAVLRGCGDLAEVASTLATGTVVVATQAATVRDVADLQALRPDLRAAYYVQDYEPWFAPPGSAPADVALLSYRALPAALLFAKTHWLCNVLALRHGVEATKVEPSLDRSVFAPPAVPSAPFDRPLRLAGMVRPRTPRRRPAETAAALARAARELGAQAVTFGCTEEELAGLRGSPPPIRHTGALTRSQVAGILRWADVFVDLSTYQAFGRTGLEAMACGCVPLLPVRGGVREYARPGVDSVLVDGGDADRVLAALAELEGDRPRLAAMAGEAVERAGRFSTARSALSIAVALRTAASAA